jgi:hypothetical protein
MGGPAEGAQQHQQLGAVTIEDLVLDDDDGINERNSLSCETSATARVHAGVPRDLDKDQQLDASSSKFHVALPQFQRCTVDSDCSSIQIPAPYLQTRLASVHQQASQLQQQRGAAWAELLPSSSGAPVIVDVQLVSLTVELHPLSQAYSVVATVQQLSKIIPGSGELAADGCGSYRWAGRQADVYIRCMAAHQAYFAGTTTPATTEHVI